MLVELSVSFFVESRWLEKVIQVFNNHNIYVQIPEHNLDEEVLLDISLNLDEKVNYDSITDIYKYLQDKLKINDIGERFLFKYSNTEYEIAPFFVLESTGNSGGAVLDDKGTKFNDEIFCASCGLVIQHQLSPLVIDTSKIKNRYMVNVGPHWVISEKMANLKESWGLKGVELQEVIHKGSEKGKQPAYQIVPSYTLPNWSSSMKHYYFATEKRERCYDCGIKGRIDGPYYYNKKDLTEMNMDVYLASEFTHDGKYVYRRTIFSKKFRDLIIENKISLDIQGMVDKNFGPKDWVFNPIIII